MGPAFWLVLRGQLRVRFGCEWPHPTQSGVARRDQAVRKWFPSEFTWRLYVVLQVAALMAFAFLVLALLADGELLKYRSVYEEVELDLAKVEANCANELTTTTWCNLIGKYHPEPDPAKRLQACIDCETKPRFVGEELVGVDFQDVTLVLILLLLAMTMPFAVIRVPTWLWEG
jgi:hypothetical protein